MCLTNFDAWVINASKWSNLLWTPPSENNPKKCNVESYLLTWSIIYENVDPY